MIKLQAPGGIALAISPRGATWMSCDVPVGPAGRRDVILRRAASDDKSFLGSTIGRYANRIAHGRIQWQGKQWQLALRAGSPHHLHGGPGGFHARMWEAQQPSATEARFTLVSPEGDQGYPGEVHAQVTYRLVDPMTIEMDMRATTTAPTPLALTNHAYFNLDGHAAGHMGDVRRHALQVQASRFTPVDRELIPLGPLAAVDRTGFDFRGGKTIQADWLKDDQQQSSQGYDHAFLLDDACAQMRTPAARLTSSAADLRMTIATTMPALQFYSGQYLAGTAAPEGPCYPACCAVALEPGFLPDSPNHPEWPQPSCWLQPGELYAHTIRYSFEALSPR
jgi:aldose 1-epimerase